MTVWGPGPFENDEAMDLVSHLLDSADANLLLEKTLRHAASDPEPESQARGIAAAEIVASGRGRPGRDLPEEVRELLALYLVHVDDDLVHLAVKALRADKGDLRDRIPEPGPWSDMVETLGARLA
jgi:hypothetical protein